MAGRNIHFSSGSTFLTWLIIGIVILVVPRSTTERINNWFIETFQPILEKGRQIQMDAVETVETDTVSLDQHQQLQSDFDNLHSQMLQLLSDYEKLSKVRSELPRFHSGLLPATVTGTLNGLTHEIIINKGSEDRVEPGQYVLSMNSNSIIGVVRETGDLISKVRLVTDAKQDIEIRIRRKDTTQDIGAMMFGDDKRDCKIAMIERIEDIRKGDMVYAAAQPGVMDIPIIIGRVSDVRPDEQHRLLWDITVQPAEDMRQLKDVMVVIGSEEIPNQEN
ncbi:MAG: rod shape-determining protein MreC [Planctomycetota bacterium]|jgi:rod shape-determining protein MreC